MRIRMKKSTAVVLCVGGFVLFFIMVIVLLISNSKQELIPYTTGTQLQAGDVYDFGRVQVVGSYASEVDGKDSSHTLNEYYIIILEDGSIASLEVEQSDPVFSELQAYTEIDTDSTYSMELCATASTPDEEVRTYYWETEEELQSALPDIQFSPLSLSFYCEGAQAFEPTRTQTGSHLAVMLIGALFLVALVVGLVARHNKKEKADRQALQQEWEQMLQNTAPQPAPSGAQSFSQVQTDSFLRVQGQDILLDSERCLLALRQQPGHCVQQRLFVQLQASIPTLTLYDGTAVRQYTLVNDRGVDLNGKYLRLDVFAQLFEENDVPFLRMEATLPLGPTPQNPTDRTLHYMLEGYFMRSGGEKAQQYNARIYAGTLEDKALAIYGETQTSDCIRIGYCAHCHRSFAFRVYSLYGSNNEFAYSDDGLDVCRVPGMISDKANWSCVVDGKIFRYYNSFCCPHCGAPYLDYRTNRRKTVQTACCVHLGRPLLDAAPQS